MELEPENNVLKSKNIILEIYAFLKDHNNSFFLSTCNKYHSLKSRTKMYLDNIKPDCLEKQTLDESICSTFRHQADLEIKKLLLDSGTNPKAHITKISYDDVSILEYSVINCKYI